MAWALQESLGIHTGQYYSSYDEAMLQQAMRVSAEEAQAAYLDSLPDEMEEA